jgi:hypothetical protein
VTVFSEKRVTPVWGHPPPRSQSSEKALGPEHPKVAATLENDAALLQAMERTEEADQLAARAKAIRPLNGP